MILKHYIGKIKKLIDIELVGKCKKKKISQIVKKVSQICICLLVQAK